MQPEKNCLHRQQHTKKLFVLKKFSPPPLQKNNGPSLNDMVWRAHCSDLMFLELVS